MRNSEPAMNDERQVWLIGKMADSPHVADIKTARDRLIERVPDADRRIDDRIERHPNSKLHPAHLKELPVRDVPVAAPDPLEKIPRVSVKPKMPDRMVFHIQIARIRYLIQARHLPLRCR